MIGKSPKTQPNTHVLPPSPSPPKGNHLGVEQEPYSIPELTQKIGEHYSISKENGVVTISIDSQNIPHCIGGVHFLVELPKDLEAQADAYRALTPNGDFIAIDAIDNTLELSLNPNTYLMSCISIRYKVKNKDKG